MFQSSPSFYREHFKPILHFHVMFRVRSRPRPFRLLHGYTDSFSSHFFDGFRPIGFGIGSSGAFFSPLRIFSCIVFLIAPRVSFSRRSPRTGCLRRRGHQFPQSRQCVDQFTAATWSSRFSSLVVRFALFKARGLHDQASMRILSP